MADDAGAAVWGFGGLGRRGGSWVRNAGANAVVAWGFWAGWGFLWKLGGFELFVDIYLMVGRDCCISEEG